MNILIITPFYKQNEFIGSLRWTNLSQRLARNHKIIVVAQPFNDMDETVSKQIEDGLLIARLNQKTLYERIAINVFHSKTDQDIRIQKRIESSDTANLIEKESFLRKVKNHFLYSTMKHKAKQYADDIVKKVIPKEMKIDVVISSACPFIEMLFGYELKKRLNCKWISDFRDLPFQTDNCDSTHIEKEIMKKTLKEADSITVVASCMKDDLIEWFGYESNKVSVITNGFSLKEKRKAKPNNDKYLHLVHTGSLYGGKRKADLLFAAINKIAEEGYKDIMFEVAGGNNTYLLESARKYNCEDVVRDYGFISREDALDLQLKADCLVALVEPFSLPAKMFEYILNQRPIICIVMGQQYDESQAKPFIETLNVGTVYEEKNWEYDVNRLSEYLKSQIQRKQNGDELVYHPNMTEVNKYDHDNITKQIEKIMQQLTA